MPQLFGESAQCMQVLLKLMKKGIELDVPELLKQVSRRGGFWCTCAIQVRASYSIPTVCGSYITKYLVGNIFGDQHRWKISTHAVRLHMRMHVSHTVLQPGFL